MSKKILASTLVLAAAAAPAAALAAELRDGDRTARVTAPIASVTGRHVVDETLSHKDVKDGSLRWSDLSGRVQDKVQAGAQGAITRVEVSGLAPDAGATTYSFSASCPAGTTVIGGGAFALSPGALLQGSYPGAASGAGANAWTGAVIKDASAPAALAVTTFAICQADQS
jgi:hypothetical protein